MKERRLILAFIAIAIGLANADTVTWTGAGNDRWHDGGNWSDGQAPSAINDYVITGSSDVQAFGTAITVNSLTGGDGSTIRVRNAASEMTGDLILTGSIGVGTKLWMADAQSLALTVNGSSTFGGSSINFDVQQAAGIFTLNLDDVIFQTNSIIKKIRDGALIFNATSLAANDNTFTVDAGSLQLGGSADYSELSVVIASNAALVVSNAISLASLTIDGTAIAPGVYNSGDAVFTTYDQLVDGGGTLRVQAPPVIWTGAGNDRWHDGENWSDGQAPSAAYDYVITGSIDVQAFGTAITVNSLTGGDGSTIRVRNAAAEMTGDLILTGSTGIGTKLWVADALSYALTVNGSSTFGGSSMSFDVQQAAGTFTLNLDDVTFQANSIIKKIRAGALVFNADSLTANSNILNVTEGSLQLGGSADYSGLGLDLTAGAQLVVADNVALANLTIDGAEINDGTYASGDAIFTTYSELVDGGGTLTIGAEPYPLPFDLEQAESSNLISNGGFDTYAIQSGTLTANIIGSYGDLLGFENNLVTVSGWQPYNHDPYGISTNVGTPHVVTGDSGVLNGSSYLDNVLYDRGGDMTITINSSQYYRNGDIQTNFLDGVYISSNATYRLEIETSASASLPDYTNAIFRCALTDGTDVTLSDFGSAVPGSLIQKNMTDMLSGNATYSNLVSGADLLAAQANGGVNVLFEQVNNKPIPGYPDSVASEDVKNTDLVTQLFVARIGFYLVPSVGDMNANGIIDREDTVLAQDILAGAGGDAATTRQDNLIAKGFTAQEALEYLNLDLLDINGDGYFDNSDVAVFESLAPSELLLKVNAAGGGLDFSWSSLIGKNYDLESSSTLDPANWTVYTNVTADPDGASEISGVPDGDLLMFFRLKEKD